MGIKGCLHSFLYPSLISFIKPCELELLYFQTYLPTTAQILIGCSKAFKDKTPVILVHSFDDSLQNDSVVPYKCYIVALAGLRSPTNKHNLKVGQTDWRTRFVAKD